MSSLTEENYLKTLYQLAEQENEITVKGIADKLDLKMPTVNNMVKKLAEKDLLRYERYKTIELTELGRKQALLILRKHRLAELFLTEVMRLGWEEVHDIAEQVEHIQSERFFNRIDEMLGNPQFDPHGEPIPNPKGELPLTQAIPLYEALPGTTYQLASVTTHHPAFLQYLDKMGLALQGTIEILEIQAFDKSMSVRLNGGSQTIFSAEVARNLLVEPVS